MRGRASFSLYLLNISLLSFCLCEYNCSPLGYQQGSALLEKKGNAMLPATSPIGAPQPFLPLLAPSPPTPFTNSSVPRLSGLCTLNFSASESMMSKTATDCWAVFAPFLANVICCPQLEATLAILMGQSSKDTGALALDATHAKHCLSDVEQILAGQGASADLQKICSIYPLNLTEASCPLKNVIEFESTVDTSKLLAACETIDPVKECCSQICQNAISEAAQMIALKDYGLSSTDGNNLLLGQSSRIDDCKGIVLRWLASRLGPSSANKVLRGLSNCNVNKESGCLLPSLPSDATFDKSSGISFLCDLNDNIAAPWPSTSQIPSSSCNKTIKLPALPAATSAQASPSREDLLVPLLIAFLMAFMTFL
ncbi:PREDICTED: uncharacterized GPI-anchored protein At1g61900-like isoform X2 [Nelumbo nucifera]|uniref:SPARK domain-containing protein n=2 Tax=Nelumbo nucifera TaxID=4432 RepID=A0A822XG88_NELNU|nr:PREDICTED: uncharacterized GPI-anchored protein At1g61900-like isoform X2 [Nelumbo nucifera]DAD20504.1 TPA_asm: hypothetical protein HUJ06_021967 [Nelumbo nucifera]